jgi:hypothetical protein
MIKKIAALLFCEINYLKFPIFLQSRQDGTTWGYEFVRRLKPAVNKVSSPAGRKHQQICHINSVFQKKMVSVQEYYFIPAAT